METKRRHALGPQFPKDPPDDLYPQDKGRELLGSFIVELRRLADHAELRARCEHTDDDDANPGSSAVSAKVVRLFFSPPYQGWVG